MSAGHFPFGISAVKSRSARLPGAGVVSPSYEPYSRRSGTWIGYNVLDSPMRDE